MHSLQQIQDLRCSQKVLQGQAKSLHRPVLSISTAVDEVDSASILCS